MPDTPGLVLVLFGASGDLAARKLLPALFDLHARKLLPARFAVLGVGRTPLSDDAFRRKIATANPALPPEHPLFPRLRYLALDPADPAAYPALARAQAALDAETSATGNALFYLSVPPVLVEPILDGLHAVGLNHAEPGAGWRRIILEKPFGRDLASARTINRRVQAVFPEEAIYRIDHFLGKETVQNILVTRFSNGIFEPLWNRHHIRRVEITAAEDDGIGARGGYYEHAGALRDMVQNHLLQILAFIAMEPPSSPAPRAVRHETLKVFESLRPIPADAVARETVRGQYTASHIRGGRAAGYREEPGVDPASKTETYAALRIFVDNNRWHGVPFCVRTGKRLPTRVTEAVIHFHPAPPLLFRRESGDPAAPNQLILRIQPDEGLLLKFNLKVPGAGFKTREAAMDFHYKELANVRLPSAYERLLLDAMQGDSTLYLRHDEAEATWSFADPILQAWEQDPDIKLYGYPAGSWGPEPAEALIAEPGETWRFPCRNLTADDTFCEL